MIKNFDNLFVFRADVSKTGIELVKGEIIFFE